MAEQTQQKPVAILEIEKLSGKTLEHVTSDKFTFNSFCLDEKGQVNHLNIYDSKLSDLSPLSTLTRLAVLNLWNNKIKDLSPLLPLISHKKLKNLCLWHNQITHIPPEFLELEIPFTLKGKWRNADKGIFLFDNPLETPPIEIIEKGNEAIASYFKQLEAAKKVQLLQCKLLIVGQGEVGKTSIMKKLQNPSNPLNEKEPTTHGIHISPWELPCLFPNCTENQTVKTFLWDFGGQDIYHATHQFFLTKRSLYILVWEARKEEESNSFNYWLNVIKLLGSGSPIIVVMNKSDIRIKSIDEFTLQKKFPNIKGFLKLSCLNNTGLKELTELITKNLGEMPHLRDLLPASWVHIRNDLENLNKNYISADEFYKLCETHKINRTDAIVIADYLHDLGTILYFRHDPLLANTVILKPEWATKAVYSLLDAIPIIENKGRFNFNQLKTYWDTELYPVSLHPQLIRLMEKFELCFNLIHTDDYFIPELLPGSIFEFDQTGYDEPGTLHFQYKYEFMPEGILSRLIARLYYLIHDQRFRKYGVELVFDKSHALIVSEPANSRIRVHIKGTNKNGMLTILRSHFNHIHGTLNMTEGDHYQEMLPCTCPTCTNPKETQTPYYYPYDKLINCQENNVNVVPCFNSYIQVSIEDLLNGFTPAERTTTLLKSVLDASVNLMGLSKSMKPDEDSRTGLMCVLLEKDGFTVKDQTRWGMSSTGKSMGRIDAMIKNKEGEETILEAFQIKGFNSNVIEDHCRKIFNYDPVGLQNNFMVVYCDCDAKGFDSTWKKYTEYISKIQYKESPFLRLEKQDEPYANIKTIRAIHSRSGKDVGIYHLFLLMGG